jgi:phosphatidylinositol 4-kinase
MLSVNGFDFSGVCFPLGKGLYRVVHIPEEEAILLNSREKAPYLICMEVLKCDEERYV